MATKTRPVKGIVWKNGSAVFLARVPGWDGVALQQADVAAIEYTISLIDSDDRQSASAVTGHTAVALTVADVIYNTLQTTDARWTLDTTGYNFAYLLDTTSVEAFETAGRKYLVTFKITPTSQPPILVVFQVDCEVA